MPDAESDVSTSGKTLQTSLQRNMDVQMAAMTEERA
jgi:hypothetical protein